MRRGEHQPLEQGVRRQPVGAVDAGARDLAARVQTRDARTTVQVGADPAAGVVGGGGDRDEIGHRVDPVRAARLDDRREAALR